MFERPLGQPGVIAPSDPQQQTWQYCCCLFSSPVAGSALGAVTSLVSPAEDTQPVGLSRGAAANMR